MNKSDENNLIYCIYLYAIYYSKNNCIVYKQSKIWAIPMFILCYSNFLIDFGVHEFIALIVFNLFILNI